MLKIFHFQLVEYAGVKSHGHPRVEHQEGPFVVEPTHQPPETLPQFEPGRRPVESSQNTSSAS